jgi:hypothetical protein
VHVPSLIADSLVEDDEDAIVSAADHVAEDADENDARQPVEESGQ